jgi:hypothetical protein
MGTVRYMSPEQVRGQEVDLRTDIYSLGATLYESLTGDTPFDGNTHFEIMTKHLSDAPRRPSKLGVTLPAAVEDVVLRSLAKRADDRFGSAREMRKLLENALRDADIGLIETQKLERRSREDEDDKDDSDDKGERKALERRSREDKDDKGERKALDRNVLAQARPVPTVPTARLASTVGPLADELEPDAPRRRRSIVPVVAAVLAVIVGGGAAAVLVLQRTARYHAAVEIVGVTLTKGATVDRMLVETDGAIEPAELARLYASTLGALRLYAKDQVRKVEIADPVDVLLAVPARALCEPTAYLDRRAPRNCESALSATAIGAKGTHRLMVVSDRAQLIPAMRQGVAQAACEFSPVEDNKLVREICDVTTRFAQSAN